MARLKDCGGLVLAEAARRTTPTRHRPPPGRAPAGGMADFRLPLADIPARLTRRWCATCARWTPRRRRPRPSCGAAQSRLPAIATILRNRTGHDFHGYKHNTFLRRVQRRMQVVQIDDIDAYVERACAATPTRCRTSSTTC